MFEKMTSGQQSVILIILSPLLGSLLSVAITRSDRVKYEYLIAVVVVMIVAMLFFGSKYFTSPEGLANPIPPPPKMKKYTFF